MPTTRSMRAAADQDIYADEGLRNRSKPSATEPEVQDAAKGEAAEYQKLLQKRGAGESKMRKFMTRLVFGWVLIFILLGIVYSGHLVIMCMVAGLQCMLFRELANVRYKQNLAKNVPLFRTIQWCWFAVAMFYVYGDAFRVIVMTDDSVPAWLTAYAPYHTWTSFGLYCVAFMVTVLSLKKNYYKYQMGQLTWTVVVLALVVFQMKSIVGNIINGIFWFMFPACLIICNDTMAYFVGLPLGKKIFKQPFLKLSPNKTWEGFLGGAILTMVFAFWWPTVLASGPWRQWLTCPATGSQLTLFPAALTCAPNAVFVAKDYTLLPFMASVWGAPTVALLPVQIHGIFLGLFASIVAPFGGFFASGIKRAYSIKDFDSIIPGHGGVMDRMDCQFLMAACTAVHYNTFVAGSVASVATIVAAVRMMSHENQQEVLRQLSQSAGQ